MLFRSEAEPLFVRDALSGELRRTGGSAPRPEAFARVGIDVHRILNEGRAAPEAGER